VGRGTERKASLRRVDGVRRLTVGISSRSMSATHACISRTSDGWVLEDARSTNGSMVNGERVSRAVLRDGDIIELGHTIFTLRQGLPTPPDTPPVLDSADCRAPHAAFATLLPSLARSFEKLARVASSNLSLLLFGETGTGKEVIAQAVHHLSGRNGGFVAVNCGAFPPNLVESSLFGHARGAFTGAVRDEPGFFRAADGGTLLLDEVGDLPLVAQAPLLRVLQEQEVLPVGTTRPVRVDVRVIAATHHSLDALTKDHRFRGDLLARLDGYRFSLPRLRDRREDLGLLIGALLGKAGADLAIAPDAGTALTVHRWPFNVRELVQVLNRALVLAERRMITRESLATALSPDALAAEEMDEANVSPAELDQKRELVESLEQHGGNVARAARAMGTSRMQVHRWLKRFGIDLAPFRRRARLARVKVES
jgi:transcriptional regulator with GAF, ATPase, and Fis domain